MGFYKIAPTDGAFARNRNRENYKPFRGPSLAKPRSRPNSTSLETRARSAPPPLKRGFVSLVPKGLINFQG